MGQDRLLIQQWFDNGGTVEGLKAEYGIDAHFGKEPWSQSLVNLKYCQIDSDRVRAHPLVVQCRGIILDTAENYRVVCRSFDRFFNVEMPEAADVDWRTSVVQEKVDGSLCQVFWYAGKWRVATSGTVEGSGECNGFDFTFSDLFWKVVDDTDLVLPTEDVGVCFIFELTSAYNRIVVQHAKAGLTLLGGRDLRTQVELPPRDAQSMYLPTATTVREFPLKSYVEIAAALETLDPLKQEGFVVVDGYFNRVKAKSARYVQLHRAKDGCNPRSLMEIARAGESSEVEGAFPELSEILNDYRARIDAWCAEVTADYERLKDEPTQKAFAIQAVLTRCSSALFALRAKKATSARQYLTTIHLDRCMEWLGVATSGG